MLSPKVCFLCLSVLFRSTPQTANVSPVISTLFTVVTPYCTFRNLAGGAVVVTTWMVLRRSPSMVEFVSAFKEAVLPLGNCLCAISEGSIRFTIQAESMSALKALWQSYQDKTLQTNLQEFLVTEEISKDEYRNALWDLMVSEREGIYH